MLWQPLLFELDGGQVPQGLVRAFFIVVSAERFCQNTRLGDTGKERLGEKFIAQAPVKTLAKPVLAGTARLNEQRVPLVNVGGLRLLYCQPAFERVGDELRPVVGAQKLRRCVLVAISPPLP